MPRTTTRSKKAVTASQSQSSQRGARQRSTDSDGGSDGNESGADNRREMDMDDDEDDARADGEPEITRKANDLVRLALFAEHKRIPLRREDISKKVLGTNARAFSRVFDTAQGILRKTFGMEIVELKSRAGLDQDVNNGEDELNDARNATGIKKKAAALGSKTYILRSVLDPLIIEYAAITDEQILNEETSGYSEEEDERYPAQPYGSIISWSTSDHLGPIGLLYTILALILVSGRVMSDMDLHASLKRFLPPTGSVSFTPAATHRAVPIEQYLSMLLRQGYLDRTQIGGDTGAGGKKGKGKSGKRGRATQADEEAGTTYEWRWGSRAQSEVGEKGIAQFVAEFMVGSAGNDEEEEEEEGPARGGRSRKKDDAEAKLAKMMGGIEKAAGGQLADLK